MNQEERKEMNYFPAALDQAVNEKFGAHIECTSQLTLDGNYITTFNGNAEVKVMIQNYIDGFIAGNRELTNRIFKISQK